MVIRLMMMTTLLMSLLAPRPDNRSCMQEVKLKGEYENVWKRPGVEDTPPSWRKQKKAVKRENTFEPLYKQTQKPRPEMKCCD